MQPHNCRFCAVRRGFHAGGESDEEEAQPGSRKNRAKAAKVIGVSPCLVMTQCNPALLGVHGSCSYTIAQQTCGASPRAGLSVDMMVCHVLPHQKANISMAACKLPELEG